MLIIFYKKIRKSTDAKKLITQKIGTKKTEIKILDFHFGSIKSF